MTDDDHKWVSFKNSILKNKVNARLLQYCSKCGVGKPSVTGHPAGRHSKITCEQITQNSNSHEWIPTDCISQRRCARCGALGVLIDKDIILAIYCWYESCSKMVMRRVLR